MTVFGPEWIQERALTKGSAMVYANFLTSMQAAQQVVTRVRVYLRGKGVRHWNHPQLVVANANEQWPGTFTVEVRMPGIPRQGYDKADEAERELALAALRASIRPGDVFQSWSRPVRRR